MVVLSVYFARSGAGTWVAVAVGVMVAKGVVVDRRVNVIIGVDMGVGAEDAQDERTNVDTKRTRVKRVNLFRMGCILPLVV